MSQPLWYLRQHDRVIGPFPSPQIREFLRNKEITADWQISLDEVDWIAIRDSKQFEERDDPPAGEGDPERQSWHREREQARHRWLNDGSDIAQAEVQDMARERRVRQALAQDKAETDTLLRQEQSRRPPVIAGLLALLMLVGSIYLVWQGQKDEAGIQAGIGLRAQCEASLAEAVNWNGCDKQGLAAPGVVARNTRMERINLEGANLTGADLSYASLAQANLRNADLRGIKLSGADMTGADLSGSDLSRADLRFAVMKNASMNGVRLEGAQLGNATWPDGRICAEGALGVCP